MSRTLRRLVDILLVLATAYAALVCASLGVFFAPWSLLKALPDGKADQLISLGVVSARSHPLYKEWLLGFTGDPGSPASSIYVMDTYKAYGEFLSVAADAEAHDSLGWQNATPLGDARVLFVGDSFGNGDSAGSRLSPPARYSALTGAKVYNASRGGYGLAQYVRIVDHLTGGLPESERFTGRDVVILLYLGNDLTADLLLYTQRLWYSRNGLSWCLALGPLRSWSSLALASRGVKAAHAAPTGLYSPVPMTCKTPGDLPFACHPGYSGFTDERTWRPLMPLAESLAAELKRLDARGLSIKVVLLPCAIQVLSGDVDWARTPPDGAVARDIPRIAANLEALRFASADLFNRHGFEVLDVTDVLRDSPERCMFFQPADTHCTARGYDAIARAISARWPGLGKSQR